MAHRFIVYESVITEMGNNVFLLHKRPSLAGKAHSLTASYLAGEMVHPQGERQS